MKIINPTDDHLNAAFAEKVAGWFRCERMGKQVLYDPEGGHVLIGDTHCMPKFTESMDAVLPWLEKFNGHTNGPEINFQSGQWEVILNGCTTRDRATCASLPRAAVIALLRAHGVEVEVAT
jgi:hypothetical protein